MVLYGYPPTRDRRFDSAQLGAGRGVNVLPIESRFGSRASSPAKMIEGWRDAELLESLMTERILKSIISVLFSRLHR
ncbi:hypothetical protein [Ottowia caeni]|uniref:hypothetical protein n=1 Tax=Ottowia caeni TaxID=2870339 RepID=UPI003D71CF56